jgi:Ca-activated chloride channel family protein
MKMWNHLLKRYWTTVLALLLLGAGLFGDGRSIPALAGGRDQQNRVPPIAARQIQVNLDKATAVSLPEIQQDLAATPFRTSDYKDGWVVRIPGGRPIATPAYSDGMIFVGGGYGSHEFYAFDAQTGNLVWQTKTSDDGPTAAVVEDGYVAFNTESCTVIVVEGRTGKLVWQEWLGDPLMSQPAISQGRLYMAHPSGQKGSNSSNAQNAAPPQVQANVQTATPPQVQANAISNAGQSRGVGDKLLCADLKTGRHIWEQDISADVISAPVIAGDKIYFTCFDGQSYCLNAQDGKVVWTKQNSGTSAPVVAGGDVVLTLKEQSDGKSYEGMKRLDARQGDERDKKLLAREQAGYLGENQGGGVGISKGSQAQLDSSVGFSQAPASANLGAANKQLGVNTVAGAWAYQGSRAVYRKGQMLNAQGRYLNSIGAKDGRFNWRAEVSGAGIGENSQVFSPPALGSQYMYLSSTLGHLLGVRQQDGDVKFIYSLNQPMPFQPSLAQGNIYVGTANGMLICLKTGDLDADGWYEWGGNAQHNKN